MGLGQACRCRAESHRQLGCGIKAKSPDHDVGDVHTWLHSHYLIRLGNGVGRWLRLKYSFADAGAMHINKLIEKETDTFPSLSSVTLLCLFDPFCSPDPYPALNPFGSFPPTLLYSDLRFSEIAGYFFCFWNCVGCASAVELQSHRWILDSSQTERIFLRFLSIFSLYCQKICFFLPNY